MTVKNYTNTLLEMLKKNPEIEHYEVIYSTDDEGNSYQKVNFTPTVMIANGLDNAYVEVQSVINITDKGNVLCVN
jgi:hypothetical protein